MDWASPHDPAFFARMAVAIAPVTEGVILLPFEAVNPLWCSLLGLGGHAAAWLTPAPLSAFASLFGLLVWPALVLAGLSWLTGRALRLPRRARGMAAGAYLLSLAWIVPLQFAIDGPLGRLPVYAALYAY